MSGALPGAHYCVKHQGNYSHYAEHNCELCCALREADTLRDRIQDLISAQSKELAAQLERTLTSSQEGGNEALSAIDRAMYRLTVAQRDAAWRECAALLAALREITPPMPPTNAICHNGVVPQEQCLHCSRIARAHAAIEAAAQLKGEG